MPVGTAALITRCPDCSTAFRATEEQLAARGGMVRCGHCGIVFDARANTFGTQAATAPDDDLGHDTADASPAAEQDASSHPDELTFLSRDSADAGAAPHPEPIAAAPVAAHALSDVPHEPAQPNPAQPHPAQSLQQAATGSPGFDFGRKKRPARAPISPWLAWPGAFMLLLALLAQAAFYFRGDLALLFPALKPHAEAWCAELGCQVPLPRRAELMSIESSDLQADSTNPGVMVLSAILRNRAPFAQTPPALELTLTDTQDQPVARRVLTAADYSARGPSGSVADTPFPPGSEVPVKVFFDASAVKASGYRLYLFYP